MHAAWATFFDFGRVVLRQAQGRAQSVWPSICEQVNRVLTWSRS
jgi:hypothetical protein